MILTRKQTIALDYLEDNITKEIGYGGGAGGGKSLLGTYWQLKQRLKYPGTRGLIGRAKLKTLKETTLVSLFEVAKLQGLKPNEHFVYNQQKSNITLFNGSEILLKDLFSYPSDPEFDELGSLEITDAFIDESAQITYKAYSILRSRIRYKLDENNLIPKILWTSNPSKNWNYTEFFLPWEKDELPENKAFVQSLVTDNPHISKHYIESLNTLDEAQKQRLLYGNWRYDNDPAKLINYDNIVNIFSNTFVPSGDRYITADIARHGSDLAVIMVWDGWRVIHIKTFEKSGIDELINEIEKLRNIYGVPKSNVLADEDGVGGGVVDVGGYKGFVNNSKPIKENEEDEYAPQYQNLKTQCYYKLADKINDDEVFVYSEEFKKEITQELEWVKRYKMDEDGKLRILPKEEIKKNIGRSPDFSDALMMRVYFLLHPKEEVFFF